MVQTLQKRYPAANEFSSTSTESVGASLATFSVDNELVTSENVVVPTRQRSGAERQQRWPQSSDSAGSYTMISGQVIAFPGFEDSVIGITEGDLREAQISDETHDRELVVKATRRVIFSKEISIDPENMRRLQPRIILEDRNRSRDDD